MNEDSWSSIPVDFEVFTPNFSLKEHVFYTPHDAIVGIFVGGEPEDD